MTSTDHNDAQPGWIGSFDAAERKKLLKDDLIAAENTLTVLLTIVTFGVLLGIVGVLLATS